MLLNEQMTVIREHQKSAPVQVTPIAEALGLKVLKVPDWPNTISGMLTKVDGKFAIFVNGTHPEVRRRFTIAHEIGHYILHSNLINDGIVEDALLRAEGLSNAVEAQANAFAADLLMPWALLNDQQARGATTIEQLAKALNVSNDAMSIRLLGLSYSLARELNAAE